MKCVQLHLIRWLADKFLKLSLRSWLKMHFISLSFLLGPNKLIGQATIAILPTIKTNIIECYSLLQHVKCNRISLRTVNQYFKMSLFSDITIWEAYSRFYINDIAYMPLLGNLIATSRQIVFCCNRKPHYAVLKAWVETNKTNSQYYIRRLVLLAVL